MRTAALLRSEDVERAVDERLNELVQGATVLGPAPPIAIKAFTGREWDPEIGLYYYRARYYDPKAGRFLSEDPIGFAGGDVNLYSYVWNNPTLFADPFGLWRYAREYGTTGANLSPGITGTEGAVDSVFQGLVQRDAVVTFTRNGVHKKDSLHYVGEAIDLRTRDLTAKQRAVATAALQLLLGDDYDVIDEGDHIHVEYQPRPSRRCGIL